MSGSLSSDAPALAAELERRFTEAQTDRFQLAYSCAATQNGLEHVAVQRPQLASFSPLPARIAAILLKYCHEKDPLLLEAALLYPAWSRAPSKEFQDTLKICQEAESAFHSKASISPPAERLALAFILDKLRHLHMTTLPRDKQDAMYAHTRERIIPFIRAAQSNTLKKLIESWLERYRRQYL